MSEEHQEDQEVEAVAQIEAEAKEMGWVPKDDFKGDPDKWRPAEEYVQRGKEVLPIVNKRLEKEQAKTAKLERQLEETRDDFKKQIEGLKASTREGMKRQREQLKAEYEVKKEKAVETGDTEAYKRAVADETKAMERLADKAEDEKAKADDKPKPSAVEEEWLEENAWFGKDKQLTRWAKTFAIDVEDDMPAASQKEKLAEIRGRLEEKFPDKFGKKRATNGGGASRVEGGSRIGGEGGGRSKWSQLPADIKNTGDELIKVDKLFLESGETIDKNLAQARERYAASYLQTQGS